MLSRVAKKTDKSICDQDQSNVFLNVSKAL